MTKPIIYRVQDREGRGPYKPGFTKRWIDPTPKANEDSLIPWMYEFPGLVAEIQFRRLIHCGCGCLDPDQLRLWFSSTEMERLTNLGYQCVQIGADKVLARSRIQCVFHRFLPLRMVVHPFTLYP